MDKKTTGIVATVAAVLLCGCPGLCMCLFGAITATGNGTFNDESLSPAVGIALVCASLIFILIPIVVGVFALRKKPEAPAAVAVAPAAPVTPPPAPSEPTPPANNDNDPLPPTS